MQDEGAGDEDTDGKQCIVRDDDSDDGDDSLDTITQRVR